MCQAGKPDVRNRPDDEVFYTGCPLSEASIGAGFRRCRINAEAVCSGLRITEISNEKGPSNGAHTPSNGTKHGTKQTSFLRVRHGIEHGIDEAPLVSLNEDRIVENRRVRKWSRKEIAGRIAWALARPLFRWSPRICWGWRRWMLRRFGAQIGRDVNVDPSVRIFIPWNLTIGDWSSVGFDAVLYNLGSLTIGRRVTVSQRTHLCGGTHDYRDPTMPLVKAAISIGDDVWVCADSFIGPGVSIEEGAIIAARSVVIRDVGTREIAAGHPAKKIKMREFRKQ